MGLRAGLDAVLKRRIPSLCRDSNPQIIQPVAQRYTTELYRTSIAASSKFVIVVCICNVKIFPWTFSGVDISAVI
jgi:hypothetical protein